MKKFDEVMKTMDQLCEATLVKQGKVKEAKLHAEKCHKSYVEEQKVFEAQAKAEEAAAERIRKEVDENNEQYKKAYDGMPTAGSLGHRWTRCP